MNPDQMPRIGIPSTIFARESDEHLVERTRRRADELTAHLDADGKVSATNMLEMIADVLVLGNRLERRLSAPLSDVQVKHMVDRFLGWRPPEDFRPDAGIRFEPEYNVEWNARQGRPPSRHEPQGTNLFDATQADAMVRHMLDGLLKS